jgi:hypothetical protein
VTLTQFLEGITVTTNTGDSKPLHYAYQQGKYQAAGGIVVAAPPADMPYVTINRQPGGRPPLRTHDKHYVLSDILSLQIHQKPLTDEVAADPANAFMLYRELLKADRATGGITAGENGATLIGPLVLSTRREPAEQTSTRALRGEIQWLERTQMFPL